MAMQQGTRRLAKVGLYLAGLALGLWILSFWYFAWNSGSGVNITLTLCQGELRLHNHGTIFTPGFHCIGWRSPADTIWWPEWGGLWKVNNVGAATFWQVALPLWLPVALGLVMTLPAVVARLRAKALHQCQRCGYDLRGLTSDKCPECGGPNTYSPSSAR